MLDTIISKPLYRVLANLTQEPRFEVALPLAVKDWVRLRLAEARSKKHSFEQRYGMVFEEFERAWREGRIADAYSYEVERDYWEWEASMTDETRLVEMTESLL